MAPGDAAFPDHLMQAARLFLSFYLYSGS